MITTLSGRFLVLTVLFVMIAEVLVFVPSVAQFRKTYLLERLERAQIASLAVDSTAPIGQELEHELLKNANVYNIVLRRDQSRRLALSSSMPSSIDATYDMRDASAATLVTDAFTTLFAQTHHTIRVIGTPVHNGGELIEITLSDQKLREAMLGYALNILWVSASISAITALLLFLAVRSLLVRPIQNVSRAITAYAAQPQDIRTQITPSSDIYEIRQAEDALQTMQKEFTSTLKQKERLAQLGGAVAKVSHDLRNILTTTQLFSDRIEHTDDPLVQRVLPKLVGSVTRAVTLCETTLAFGKAEEPQPRLERVSLMQIVDDVFEGERLSPTHGLVTFSCNIPSTLMIRADKEQIFRVLLNFVRNARQAITASKTPANIDISAHETERFWCIHIFDTGPGLPAHIQKHLFKPFQSATKGGSGLGLVIASELVQGHGGRIKLETTGPDGTCFVIELPKGDLF